MRAVCRWRGDVMTWTTERRSAVLLVTDVYGAELLIVQQEIATAKVIELPDEEGQPRVNIVVRLRSGQEEKWVAHPVQWGKLRAVMLGKEVV